MYNEIAAKPEDLSGIEWKLLQHLANYTDTFSADAAFVKLQEDSILSRENSILKFRKYFTRLKFLGYIVMIPFAFASMGSNATPSYRLTMLGRTIFGQH